MGAPNRRYETIGTVDASIALNDMENIRYLNQVRSDSLKSLDERNEMGQYATPPALALDIVHYIKILWKDRNESISFLEPALGTGSFYSALLREFSLDDIESASGVEIDPALSKIASDLWCGYGLKVVTNDFTQLPPSTNSANLLITNPPYVRHHHLDSDKKVELKELVKRRLGLSVSGLAGLYVYYMLLAHDWISDGGLSVWLIPREFMDVNYGEVIRQYLLEKVSLIHIHVFDVEDVQFSDALVSSTVVVFRKSPPNKEDRVKFTYGGSIIKPNATFYSSKQTLKEVNKWTKVINNATEPITSECTTLGQLFKIKRGIATGANDFFLLPHKDAMDRGIPKGYLHPVLPGQET